MQQFQIILKNEKIRFYNQISWIIIFIHIVIFIYFSFFAEDKRIQTGSIASLIMLFSCFLIRYILVWKNSKWFPGFTTFYSLLMVSWVSVGYYWIAFIPGIFDILTAIVCRKLVSTFSKSKIIYPSFPSKTFEWEKLNNVILKDGLLTIDLKNNKLIQQYIEESKTLIDEKEFNDFCREQLKVKKVI
jgi:hypothetical protein